MSAYDGRRSVTPDFNAIEDEDAARAAAERRRRLLLTVGAVLALFAMLALILINTFD